MRVLFVCVENSCRSQMAEGLARMQGAEAFSAGSRPSGVVNPGAVSAMAEVGYDMARHRSKPIDEFHGAPFDVAVTMGCGDDCRDIAARKVLDWPIPDPKAMGEAGFRHVRDQIARQIDDLL